MGLLVHAGDLPAALGHQSGPLTDFQRVTIAGVALQGPGINPLQDRRGAEQREGQEYRPVADAIAATTATVTLQQCTLIGNTALAQIQTVQTAYPLNTVGQMIWQTEVSQISQRMTNGGQLPIQHRHYPRLIRRQQQ